MSTGGQHSTAGKIALEKSHRLNCSKASAIT